MVRGILQTPWGGGKVVGTLGVYTLQTTNFSGAGIQWSAFCKLHSMEKGFELCSDQKNSLRFAAAPKRERVGEHQTKEMLEA